MDLANVQKTFFFYKNYITLEINLRIKKNNELEYYHRKKKSTDTRIYSFIQHFTSYSENV